MSISRTSQASCALVLLALLDSPLGALGPRQADQAPPAAPAREAAVTAPRGKAMVRGRVVRADTGAPLRRADVTVTGEGNLQRQVTTDPDGRYAFADLPSGRFTISASRGGYLALQYGQRRPFEPGRPLELREAQTLDDVDFSLPRASVITGRITDERGAPFVGAEVAVERYRYAPDGQRRLNRVPGMPFGGLRTDDRGEFRAFGLMPGEYVVSATVRQFPPPLGQGDATGPVEGYLPTFYPGTATASEAHGVVVGLAQEVPVQFGMLRGRISRISGTIVDSTGQPAAGASLMLATPARNALGASGMGAGTVAGDGGFSIGSVTPGEHYIQARVPPRPGGSRGPEVANVPIVATGDDLTGLRIETSAGTTVVGRVEWEGTAPRAGADRPMRIVTSAADRRPALIGSIGLSDPSATGAVGPDATFRIAAVLGSVLFSPEGVPPQWTLRAIVVNGVDVTTVPVDAASLGDSTPVRVVLSDRLTELSGTVRDERGALVREYVVVVLPDAPVESTVAARYTRTARPDQRGAYSVRGLAAGRYVVGAAAALEEGAEWDPVFQASIRAAARRVTLSEGQTLAVDLELLP